MPDPITAMVGGSVASSLIGADAAESAANTQAAASAESIAETRRQFDALQGLLKPYADIGLPQVAGMQRYAGAGAPALAQQQALIGLSGPDAQRAAISQIEQSPQMASLVKQGENAILQNASATGGLRGGNTQAALAQFRPQMLNALIDSQYSKLGGMTALGQMAGQNLLQIGQASAAQTGVAGMNSAAQIGSLMGERGAAQAGGILGNARAMQGLAALPGQYMGLKASGLFGGTNPAASAGSFTPDELSYFYGG